MSVQSPAKPVAPPRTVGELVALFLDHMQRERGLGRSKARSVAYYRGHLGRWVRAVGADLPLSEVRPDHLERFQTGWHFNQAVRRHYNWAVFVGLIATSPVAGVKRPAPGLRKRVLTRAETIRLLRGAIPAFRAFLIAKRLTKAHSAEIRKLRWSHLIEFPDGLAFVRSNLTGGARYRADVKVRVRVLGVDARLRRLLDRLRRRRTRLSLWDFARDDFVFLGRAGRPYTKNSVGCAVMRLRIKVGLDAPEREESIVLRRSRGLAAVLAVAERTRGRVLAHLMGPGGADATTGRPPLRAEDLAAAIRAAIANGRCSKKPSRLRDGVLTRSKRRAPPPPQ